MLAVNHMRCPLTDLAARYTVNREDNYDIYLPPWLARHNKQIFGRSSPSACWSCSGPGSGNVRPCAPRCWQHRE